MNTNEPHTNTSTATTASPRDLTEEEMVAHFLSPERAATRTILALHDPHLGSGERPDLVIQHLRDRIDAAAAGDMTDARRILASQMLTLERMTQYLFARAAHLQDSPNTQERFMRMAMRAQAQCHHTAQLMERMAPEKKKATAPAASKVPAPSRVTAPIAYSPRPVIPDAPPSSPAKADGAACT